MARWINGHVELRFVANRRMVGTVAKSLRHSLTLYEVKQSGAYKLIIVFCLLFFCQGISELMPKQMYLFDTVPRKSWCCLLESPDVRKG